MSRVNHRAKLAELRALRKSGKTAFDSYKVEEVDSLYDEVDEAGYKNIVRERLNEDDFVVDDNGLGYADDGREEWDREPQNYSDSDNDLPARGRTSKAAKKQKHEEQARQDANDRSISEYFTKGAVKAKPKPKAVKTQADDDFMADLLGEVDTNIPTPGPRTSKLERSGERRKARVLSPPREPTYKRTKTVDTRLPSPPAQPFDEDDDAGWIPPNDDAPLPTSDIQMSDPAPSSPTAKVAQRKTQIKQEPKDEDEDDDMMEVAHTGAVQTTSVNLTGTRPVRKLVKPDPYPSPAASSPLRAVDNAVDASAWNDLNDRLNVVTSSPAEVKTVGKIDYKDAVESDGSLNFFWTDYTETRTGSLCLFGKVLNKKTRSYVSCFVKIDSIQRKLFFLPRKQRVAHGEETDEEVTMGDVYGEVDDKMTSMNVGRYKIKPCTRKYAFELPGVPKEAEYMKLLYPYTSRELPDTPGETYSHVFGTNTSLFEQFVLWKNIMGPCWLKIEDGDYDTIKNASHCKLEVSASHPKMVSVLADSDNLDTPPITLMSLALRTAFNTKENKQEILAISARIFDKVLLSDTTPVDKMPCKSFTVMRPHGQNFPMEFEALARHKKKGSLVLKKQESDLLSYFLAQVDLNDPDVIIGHQLEGVGYSILLSRLHEKKTHQWSRLGRLRRTEWPGSIGKVGGNVFAERQVMSGRLLCDLSNDQGRSMMFKCQSYSLTEMASIYLQGPDNRRRDVDNEQALSTWASKAPGLMDYVSHLETDTHYIAALALGIQILPLTKVLTNLAGNSWARTLTGTRAERNEYILLHEFHRNKYICPDKQRFGRGRPTAEGLDEETGEGKKKDKYKGGLVFEPEKGLYDRFVLVMDFNSLYPSIIQEFNICFTTVDRTTLSQDGDAVPDVPVSQEQGVLPRLISTLVSRRRQVKSLMKDKKAKPEQLATWDIKQLALKLTANSMYGCLGYDKSRFYARPLAVLTTFKGREILQSTKALAESKFLQVIYGDTDSVMINANVETLEDAFKVGSEFKKAVNEQYKLLEIDIDNVFRRILLQAKKKYAAINMEEKNGKYVERMEVKGLDMKRREFCAQSKDVSSQLLQLILSGEDIEKSVAQIHDYLRETAQKMRDGGVPTGKYIIHTQLGKSPKEYPNADSMPSVQVALRELARGKTVRKGDVVPYIITGDSNSSDPAPKRARSPGDLKTDPELKIDVEYYIAKQIFPPVERLCANIIGTSTTQLAECLGLDVRKYSSFHNNTSSNNDLEIHPLESQIPDSVRFADCARLSLRCRKCKAASDFTGMTDSLDRISSNGLLCSSCGATFSTLSIVAQIEHAVRQQTCRYYEGWLVCDDSQCGNRTRQMSVYGTRCLGPKGLARDCLGRMRYEYTEKAIYNQLVYFASLWDVDKAKTKAASELGPSDRDKLRAMAEHNRVRFGTVKGTVDKYLDKCGRQWIAMDTLFAKLGFNKLIAAA